MYRFELVAPSCGVIHLNTSQPNTMSFGHGILELKYIFILFFDAPHMRREHHLSNWGRKPEALGVGRIHFCLLLPIHSSLSASSSSSSASSSSSSSSSASSSSSSSSSSSASSSSSSSAYSSSSSTSISSSSSISIFHLSSISSVYTYIFSPSSYSHERIHLTFILAHSAQSRHTKSAQQPTPASATAPAPAVAAKNAEVVEPGGGPLDISLEDKRLFIESLLIPAFDPDNELETSKERKEWMKKRANNTNWDAGVSAELIIRYGTIKSLPEAKAERLQAEAKAERALEKAEAKAEREMEKAEENERKRGKSSIIYSSSSFSCLLLSCMISCS